MKLPTREQREAAVKFWAKAKQIGWKKGDVNNGVVHDDGCIDLPMVDSSGHTHMIAFPASGGCHGRPARMISKGGSPIF